MSTSNNRSRRKHRGKAQGHDDEGGPAPLVSRADASHTDFDSGISPYSYKKKDTYIPSSSRSGYSMNRDGPSSHADSQDRFYKHPSEAHHRSGRDGYDTADSRDGDHWGARKTLDTHQKGNRERTTREHDQGYSTVPRGELQRWGKSGFYDDRPHPNREAPDRRRGEPDDERGSNWESHGRGNRRWQSDNGWDTRKRDRHQNRRPPDNQDESPQATEDRAWEPGPGWQSRGGGQGHRNQRPRNNYTQGKNKGKKMNQNRQRQRGDRERDRGRHLDRERRQPEDTLNNWQRREIHPLPPRPRSPLKRVLTPSRSRSQSPESFYSRRSSRSRSRSRSCSPRPNTYYSSPPGARSRSPLGKGREESRSRSPASSQRSRSNEGRLSRRRSISSSSSYSRSRSRSSSRSPDDRPKAKHRLPAVTSIMNISLSMSKAALHQRSEFTNSRGRAFNRNGNLNGKQRVRGPLSPETERQASRQMPPPDTPPATAAQVQQGSAAVSPTSTLHDIGSPSKARFGLTKSAGFKPIGQASSSVKLFFPQDDEVSEGPRSPQHSEHISRTELPIKRSRQDISSDREGDDRDYPHRAASVQQGEVSWQSKEPGMEPMAPPSPLLRDATRAPPSPKHARSGDVTISPGLHARLPEPEVDGITRPSSPSASPKELYTIVSQVGEGTFGKVYKARNTITNVHVALKRIRMESEKDGFPVTAMREIKLLQSLRHQNVVRLFEMMVSNGSVFMVFEYMDHDLTGVLSQTQFAFSEANLKSLCSQMLAGLAYLHHKGVIHRDIKGSNILINNRGELKLADFGLARFYQKRRRNDYTNRVITLWYRPPELLFGATVYGPEVDMWSAGCIMLELFTKKPIFQGNDEIHQLEVIYRVFGTPTPERWPGITELPWYELVKPKEVAPDHFRELFQRWLSPAALDLAEQLLTYDPAKRVTAIQALEAPYFKVEQPPPELPVGLSLLEGEWHELETKRERARKRRKLENALQEHPI